MTEREARQRLAAVLVADAVGYTGLMRADEAATVAGLDAARAVFSDQITRERGRIVDMAGDSLLAVFDSAAGAVRAALAVQDTLDAADRDNAVSPERRMRFRIGVNLGDIIEKADGTIYGDGVNVAARLESIAAPGRVAVSDPVRQLIKDRLEVRLDDLGEHRVKNVAEPVRVFTVGKGGAAPEVESRPAPGRDKPSIAVLPFTNMSGDPEQEYFSDGISEDIITDLSKLSGLIVIARNSTFAYKGRSPNIQQVCRELGAAYVLEGSVRKAGGRVRINAQLIVGRDGSHLWADRYDRNLDDIFEVQDDVTRQIVDALKVRLTETEQDALSYKGTSNLDAYDAYLRAREAFNRFSRDSVADAKAWLEKALALDPRFADALALLASSHITDFVNDWSDDRENSRRLSLELGLKAVAADDRCAHAHAALGIVRLWSGELDPAIGELEQAVALDPNFAPAYVMLGMTLHYSGSSQTALTHLATARRLDPYRPDFNLHVEALCHFMLGDYDEAAKILRERIAVSPETDISRVLLAAAYGHLGETERAKAMWAELTRVNPTYSFAERRKILPYRNPEDLNRIAEGLRKAGLDVAQESG